MSDRAMAAIFVVSLLLAWTAIVGWAAFYQISVVVGDVHELRAEMDGLTAAMKNPP